jgi:hypothetical protein
MNGGEGWRGALSEVALRACSLVRGSHVGGAPAHKQNRSLDSPERARKLHHHAPALTRGYILRPHRSPHEQLPPTLVATTPLLFPCIWKLPQTCNRWVKDSDVTTHLCAVLRVCAAAFCWSVCPRAAIYSTSFFKTKHNNCFDTCFDLLCAQLHGLL